MGCTTKYSLVASGGSKFSRTMTTMGTDSVTIMFINSSDTSLTHSCSSTAYKRKFSLSSLSLANMRRRLIRRVCTVKGPIVIMLIANGPFSVS